MLNLIKKIQKNKHHLEYNRGMTYVELIVVMSIFAVMSSVVIFNYGAFQGRVDVTNLANDIALKVVEAQRTALSGKLPPVAQQALITSPLTWKPSYGIYLAMSSKQNIFYFSDVNSDKIFEDPSCVGVSECLDKITITRGDSISGLNVFYQGDPAPHALSDVTLVFTRPNSGPSITSSTPLSGIIYYVQINITSPQNLKSSINVYASGRVDIK